MQREQWPCWYPEEYYNRMFLQYVNSSMDLMA